MQSKGYDGKSGLGLNQDGRIEPIFVSQWPKGVGLGFRPIQIGIPSTPLPLLEEVSDSEDIKTSHEPLDQYHYDSPESNNYEWDSLSSTSSMDLDKLFGELDLMLSSSPNPLNSCPPKKMTKEEWFKHYYWESLDPTSW